MKNRVTKNIFALFVIVMMLLAVSCTNDLNQDLPEDGNGVIQDLPGAGGAATDGVVTDGATTDGATTDGAVVTDGAGTEGDTTTDGYPVTDEGAADAGGEASGGEATVDGGATDGSGETATDAGGEAGATDGSGEGAATDGSGEGAVEGGAATDGSGDGTADGSGEGAATDGTGEGAATDGSGEGAATDGSGEGATDGSGDAATSPEAITHVIQFGDTVGTIAQQYGVSIQDIVVANNLPNEHSITAGETLQIVAGAADAAGDSAETTPQFDPNNFFIHVVSYGETLFVIGQRYGYTVQELADYNGIVNVNQIKFNQEIKIPNR